MVKPNKPGSGGKKAQLRHAQALQQAARFLQARDLRQAEQIYLELLRDNPADLEANLQLAQLYQRAGRGDLAPALLRNLPALQTFDAATCNRIGIGWHQAGHPQEARAAFERAVMQKPAAVEYRYNLGLALRDQGLPAEATASFSKCLESMPDHLPSLLQLGSALRESDRLQDALEAFQRALALGASSVDVYKHLALIHVDLAHIDEAIRCWEKVLELDPACALAHLRLSHLRKRDHAVATMETLFEKADKPLDKIYLAFGLGKAFEDNGDYDRAFRFLLEGNQLKRKQFRYSIDEWRVFFEKLQDIFSADFLHGFPGGGLDDETPIFILGMPRSGSSLVEQILASHPEVFGAGELKLLPALCTEGAKRRGEPFPEYFRNLDAEAWRELGREYIAGLRRKQASAPRITDKMPQNFRFLGAISLMLPRARIVHCQRSPMDNCWSIYKNLFADGHPYAYDLQELGQFYSYYQALMRHWNEVLPGRIYNIRYEQLVSEPQTEIAALLEFCGLPFDQRCVDFHRNERAVDTMSAAQVKQPINRDSIERWTLFREHLAPLSEILLKGD
jgi:tetratricopeptide (TPR) repeat protein